MHFHTFAGEKSDLWRVVQPHPPRCSVKSSCRSWETYTEVCDPDGTRNQHYGGKIGERIPRVKGRVAGAGPI